MAFDYKVPTAFMGATTLVLLLSGFKGINSNHLTTTHLVYAGLRASPESAWLGLPLPPPPEDPKPATSRDPLLCLITPSSTDKSVSEVWSSAPYFVWAEKFLAPEIRSSVARIAIVLPSSQTVVWSQRLPIDRESITTPASPWRLQQLAYDGVALEAEQIYVWHLLDSHDRSLGSGSFRVMALAEQRAITAELASVEEDMANQSATAAEIAAAKVQYFADRQMWADAMQMSFSVEAPSTLLVKFQSQIPNRVCGTP
ncbi:hypothetical protein IQ254_15555 [Nodosilinea sp. LEGE 07088]|uniref:hypothetical protein n=1 Tax=Nodosilinea sp. LEGE 07088 TaxID=2777968 RepID=UPI001882AEC0|nr:hypothetical protein [Nodosilinea sp. LEGE 07088]MBE9138589.1 hypothetical protein [Nodosilinea sp. LEGE 07088]